MEIVCSDCGQCNITPTHISDPEGSDGITLSICRTCLEDRWIAEIDTMRDWIREQDPED